MRMMRMSSVAQASASATGFSGWNWSTMISPTAASANSVGMKRIRRPSTRASWKRWRRQAAWARSIAESGQSVSRSVSSW